MRIGAAVSSRFWFYTGLGGGVASLIVAPCPVGLLGAALAALMAAIGAVDSRRLRIPDALNAAAFAAGCIHACLASEADVWIGGMAEALARAGVAFSLLFGLRLYYERIRGLDAIGLGDVKLAGVAGLWLGPVPFAIAIELAVVGALAGAYIRGRRRGRRLGRRGRVPFGAFFGPAIWCAWVLQTGFGW